MVPKSSPTSQFTRSLIFLNSANETRLEKDIFWRFLVVVKWRNPIGSLALGIEKPSYLSR